MVINQNLTNRHGIPHICNNINNRSAEVDRNTTGGSITSLNTKNIHPKKTRSLFIPPNQLPALSAVSENRVNYTRTTDIPSSFPYTADHYKTDLDKFLTNSRRYPKEIKKNNPISCNNPKLIQHLWTGGERKESDYCERESANKKKADVRTKRLNRRTKAKVKDSEYYALDEIYSSQFNLELDGKSTSTCRNKTYRQKSVEITNKSRKDLGSQDVWSVIRNINKFQFIPSPAVSEDSVVTIKRKSYARKNNECLVGAWRANTNNVASNHKPRNYLPSTSTFFNTTTIGSDKIEKKIVYRSKSLGKNGIPNDQHNFDESKLKSQIERVNEIVEKKIKENGMKEMGDCVQLQNKKCTTYKTNKNNYFNIKNNKELTAAENKEIKNINVYTENNNFSCSSKSEIIKTPRELKEITAQNTRAKIVTNKSQIDHRTESQMKQRKQRLVTTMPRTSMIPKMTQKEVKRRLSEYKYPIIILGNDQTSPFILNEHEHPQYSGMEDHIWPFMTEWLKNKDKKKVPLRQNPQVNLTNRSKVITQEKKNTANIELNKVIKVNKIVKLKKPRRRSMEAIEQEVQRKQIKGRDEVINILYKNCSPVNYRTVEYKLQESLSQIKISCYKNDKPLMDVSTETIPETTQIKTNSVMKARTNKSDLSKNMKRTGLPHKQWHDNVQSVIQKIFSGMYFSDSEKSINNTLTNHEIKPKECYNDECRINENDQDEIITQASICNDDESNNEVQVLSIKEQKDVLILIPGFDEILPPLEIETVRDSHVNVKHCITRVIVQFDMTVMGTNNLRTNNQEVVICTPLVTNEADNKIFKCETKIFNATLPAELCSILPKLMSGVFKTESDIDNAVSTAACDMLINVLNTPTIPRMTPFGCNLLINLSRTKMLPTLEQSATNICGLPILPIVTPCFTRDGKFQMPRITKGYFAQYPMRAAQSNEFRTNKILIRYDKFGDMHTLLPKFLTNFFHKHPILLASILQMRTTHDFSTNFDFNYVPNSQVMLTNSNTDIKPLVRLDDYNGLLLIDEEKVHEHEHLAILPKSDDLQTVSQFDIEDKEKHPEAFTEGKQPQMLHCTKKNRFIRLYRKCKSSCSVNLKLMTPLNEITNLEKFLHVLGIGKMFSVFDTKQAEKIMFAISQLKTWSSEISCIQALLLLLLMNKKETPNMVRYQSIILQGIATNRINNASELDVEIELIELENFRKLNEFEGFSYMAASVENCNSILEEMCWIAKTTASNYRLPYDASSEQLLKSLVDKQQRLNPKYLKLMAKYVGLGLLKPKSNTNKENEDKLMV